MSNKNAVRLNVSIFSSKLYEFCSKEKYTITNWKAYEAQEAFIIMYGYKEVVNCTSPEVLSAKEMTNHFVFNVCDGHADDELLGADRLSFLLYLKIQIDAIFPRLDSAAFYLHAHYLLSVFAVPYKLRRIWLKQLNA